MSTDYKSSAELEREVEAQRARVERRIGEIQERLSPGQLLDEALSYTKNGGAQFASNLGENLAANPIPSALVGIGLAWLISGVKPGGHAQRNAEPASRSYREDNWYRESSYPYVTVKTGRIKRVAHKLNDAGEWYSEFADDAGRAFKAKSNELGQRTGHFVDDAGKTIAGFIDDAGERITDFRDEAGNRLDDAFGWARHNWHDAKAALTDVAGQVANQAQKLGEQAKQVGSEAQAQTDRMVRMAGDMFNKQPLIGGALAFAAGAALGAALPHTEPEDRLLGEASDQIKGQVAQVAGDVYEDGKEKVAELYEMGKEQAAEVYEKTKEQAAGIYDKATEKAGDAYQQAKATVIGSQTGNGQVADLH